MKKLAIILVFILKFQLSFSQSDSISSVPTYSFIVQDSPSLLFSMRQFNQNYLSAYRLFAQGMDAAFSESGYSDIVQMLVQSFFFLPLTHEEGHRSILTANNIGSISQPYFNKHGAAYVIGVSNSTLRNLRDHNLPEYIRLHTAGLESDYMLTRRMETMGSFQAEKFRNYRWEYWLRKTGIMQYYLLGLIAYDIDLDEEDNELERDIVGMDTYGAARHLYRPDMDFYRYTRYDDLSTSEKVFVRRMGYRSFLNLLNPLLIGREGFPIGNNTRVNAGMGYTLSPFGDFIDENIWIKHKSLNLHLYARQFQNHTNWFHAGGLGIYNLRTRKNIFLDLQGHIWQQPKEFNFHSASSFYGGALEADIRFFNFRRSKSSITAYSIDLGFIYKSKGFLPEEVYMKEHFGIRIGTSFRLH